MKSPKIDFKGAVTKAAGHAAGGALYTQVNKLAFMQKQANPKVKGAIVAALGYLVGPLVATKMKLTGKGSKADFVASVCEGMGMIGVMQMANSFVPGTAERPAIFPQIAGGYPDYHPVAGMATIEDGMTPAYAGHGGNGLIEAASPVS